MAIKKGDKIKVEYEEKLEDGTVFDSTAKHDGKPLDVEVGAGQVIPGFENALIGMEKGEEKEVTLESKDGYGEANPDLKKVVPRDQMPKDQEPKQGMMLVLGAPDGRQIPAKIAEVNDKEVTLDLNHPLCGKTIIFKIKVVEV